MPPGWIHETIDMIAWGRVYWSVHSRKDKFWQELGTRHRIKEHDLYQEGRALIKRGVPIEEVLNWMYEYAKKRTKSEWKQGLTADVIEAHQAELAHECWDLLWDDFTSAERLGIAGALRDVVLRPGAYPNLFVSNDYMAMRKSGPWKRLQGFVRARKAEELT